MEVQKAYDHMFDVSNQNIEEDSGRRPNEDGNVLSGSVIPFFGECRCIIAAALFRYVEFAAKELSSF